MSRTVSFPVFHQIAIIILGCFSCWFVVVVVYVTLCRPLLHVAVLNLSLLHTYNSIFSNQAFIKRLQYDSLSGTFKDFTGKTDFDFQQLQPSQDAEADAKQREKVIAWVKRERLPLFLK